jgi:hypothetical protein
MSNGTCSSLQCLAGDGEPVDERTREPEVVAAACAKVATEPQQSTHLGRDSADHRRVPQGPSGPFDSHEHRG